LKLAADALAGRGGVSGVVPGGAAGEATTVAEEDAGYLGVGYAGAKNLSTAFRGALGRTLVGAAALWGFNKWGAPFISKHVKNPQERRTIDDATRGATVGGTIGSYVTPVVGTAIGAGLGAGIGALYSMGNQDQYSKVIRAYVASHSVNTRYASQAALGVTSANFASRAQAVGMSPSTIAGITGTGTNSVGSLAAGMLYGVNHAAYADKTTGVSYSQLDLSAAAKKYSVTADSLKTASDVQKTAAQQTNTSATRLSSAASSLETAAHNMNQAAANAAVALLPSSIYNAAKAGLKNSIVRK
jgi:hypothetical protein